MKVGFSDLELKVLLESPVYVSIYSTKAETRLVANNTLLSICIDISNATSNAMIVDRFYRANKLLTCNTVHFLNKRTWLVNRELLIDLERC